MENLFFLAGIHGVGKNFMLNKVKFLLPINHLSASEVLQWKEINDNSHDKKVSSISKTQDLLVTNLKKIVKNDRYYILDGHFTLLNKDGKIERIPENTFFQINPRAVIVKIADPAIIWERLKKRDNKDWNIDDIILMQNEEISYAKDIALKLNIPFYLLEDNQENLLISIINFELQNG